MSALVCSDPRHALRSAEPDWSASLGTVTGTTEPQNVLCGACARLRVVEATEDGAHLTNEFTFRRGGRYQWTQQLVYTGGVVVGTRVYRQLIAAAQAAGAVTAGQVTAFRNFVDALRDYAKANPQ